MSNTRSTRRLAAVVAMLVGFSGLFVATAGHATADDPRADVTSMVAKKNNTAYSFASVPVALAVTLEPGASLISVYAKVYVNGSYKGLKLLATGSSVNSARLPVDMKELGAGKVQIRGTEVKFTPSGGGGMVTAQDATVSNEFFVRQASSISGPISRRGNRVTTTITAKYHNAAQGKSVPLKRKKLILQAKYGKKWKTIAKPRTNKKGKVTVTRTVVGKRYFRVVLKPSLKIAGMKGRSTGKV